MVAFTGLAEAQESAGPGEKLTRHLATFTAHIPLPLSLSKIFPAVLSSWVLRLFEIKVFWLSSSFPPTRKTLASPFIHHEESRAAPRGSISHLLLFAFIARLFTIFSLVLSFHPREDHLFLQLGGTLRSFSPSPFQNVLPGHSLPLGKSTLVQPPSSLGSAVSLVDLISPIFITFPVTHLADLSDGFLWKTGSNSEIKVKKYKLVIAKQTNKKEIN